MDDAAAIGRCAAGDREAFRFLVGRYEREALGHAVAILGNQEDACDAVQDTFLDAFQQLQRCDPSRRFYPWFYVMLRNRCFKLLAAREKRMRPRDRAVILDGRASRASAEAGDLEQALHGLAPEERELLTLKYLDGLTYDDLATRLGIPRGTVMSRLYHARRRLRGKLAPGHEPPGTGATDT
jgi:RNA polymerase sigma-70 factor (ECF subfamily)